MLKEGDYVKVTKQVVNELEEVQENWGGQIVKIHKDWEGCDVKLDADTLNTMEDKFVKKCRKEGLDPHLYTFSFDDLELTSRKDTDESYQEAVDKLDRKLGYGEADDDDYYEKGKRFHELRKKWVEEFEKSKQHENLAKGILKESAKFVADTFMDIAFRDESVVPAEWDKDVVNTICLELVPIKISANENLFKHYGDGLIAFFKFLKEKKYIDNAQELIEEVAKIKDKITKTDRPLSHDGMTQKLSAMMKLVGYDSSKPEDVAGFMEEFRARVANAENDYKLPDSYKGSRRGGPINSSTDGSTGNSTGNPYKGLGRNDKITVKYSDGKIIENIKFKKVEKDLRAGNCEWIKE